MLAVKKADPCTTRACPLSQPSLGLPASERFVTRRHSRRLKRTPRLPRLSLRTHRSMSREPERVNSDTSDPSRLQMAGAFFLSQASAAAGVRVGGEATKRERASERKQ